MVCPKSIVFYGKVGPVYRELGSDKADGIQVFAPQIEVEACLTTSLPPLTTESHGAASLHIVGTDVIAKSDVTLEPKIGMVRQDTKMNCDDVKPCLTTSSLSSEGAAALVPNSDFVAEMDSTLTLKHDRNDRKVSAPSFDETMDLLGLSSNAGDTYDGSVNSRKNEGLCNSREQYDTQALIEAAAKIKLPPQTPRRRKTTGTG
ncbi:uncharacterized protein [Ptychodera flava]|uniref:uncharacterized protein n=1 Tax=Ptychodera flava TaxID=63121 RepID=UPI00396A4F97